MVIKGLCNIDARNPQKKENKTLWKKEKKRKRKK